MDSAYNPFNIHQGEEDSGSCVVVCNGKPIKTNLHSLLEINILRTMHKDEFNEYQRRVKQFRQLTEDEVDILKGVDRKIKAQESLRKCRIKKKEEIITMEKEIALMKLKTSELQKENGQIADILSECENCRNNIILK
ncbi:hypothetical protein EDI_067180 [Entamoeba dispar SAW760]|uniref:FAM192A/Fyv6 N-terminal domain-containing protein n=1 Tax=Entamoeba dispar (strain ATCC PRA-260 / SAW760) TaxID=370354 RepID=B0EFZ9_ENTDS|nr:uncharacterized protein EDI_067180 [Entamoeba dispar SAW760]EDR26550.1 hypothetical protein EDI_067180 [Entamoeba dispar SAW760]|eukprot:EDR26550.1 hypothetical protein EDI_067180 [Entamoeba dispar SAW760]